LVTAGVDIGGFLAVRDLKAALLESFRINGYQLERQKNPADNIATDSAS
jgi:hypothetical protein